MALRDNGEANSARLSHHNFSLYGGTYNLFHYTLPRLGIRAKFAPAHDLEAVRRAIGPKTKAVFAESIGNPKLDVADLSLLSQVAHAAGVPPRASRVR
ncbi:MAG TPA: PLP-dependent transferase, partial [Polyangiales bacterium]|nr:PLP-dependent transferase [Polyangiales bacterium]